MRFPLAIWKSDTQIDLNFSITSPEKQHLHWTSWMEKQTVQHVRFSIEKVLRPIDGSENGLRWNGTRTVLIALETSDVHTNSNPIAWTLRVCMCTVCVMCMQSSRFWSKPNKQAVKISMRYKAKIQCWYSCTVCTLYTTDVCDAPIGCYIRHWTITVETIRITNWTRAHEWASEWMSECVGRK